MPTCLFFDEMPVIRKIGERILQMAKFDTVVVETIDGVADYLAEHPCPDLVILSGTGTAQGIAEAVKGARQNENGKHAVILVSVIERNIGALMRYRRAGANGVLMKPFDADGFRETLAVHLRAAELAA